tara:strand:+ start:939 stop:1160 length:222 start_codon:yes stop_codon:yes gene_type:complete
VALVWAAAATAHASALLSVPTSSTPCFGLPDGVGIEPATLFSFSSIVGGAAADACTAAATRAAADDLISCAKC